MTNIVTSKTSIMKKIFIIILFCIISSKAEAQWTTISQSVGAVESMEFVSPTKGFASSTFGTSVSNDGGVSWATTQISGVRDVDFIDALNGVAIGWFGLIKQTNDGGVNWSTITPPNSTSLWGVSMISIDTFFISIAGGKVYRTYNGGASFTIQTVNTTGSAMTDIVFTSGQNGCVTASGGKIYQTTNGGNTWGAPVYTPPITAGMNALFFVNASVGYAVGSSGIIVKTINGGSTWTTQTSGTLRSLRSIHFCDISNGFAVGDSGTVLRTVNGGATWFFENVPSTIDLEAVHVFNPNSAIIGGLNVFYKNTNLTTDIGEIETNYSCSVFPNPGNDYININLSPAINNGRMVITDLTGRILINDNFIGKEKSLDISELPRGLYLLQISNGNFFVQRKIIRN